MSEKSQVTDPDKTANEVFKMRYGVPIQGANYITKCIIKTSREESPNVSSLEEWPQLSPVITKNNNNQKKTYAMRVSQI